MSNKPDLTEVINNLRVQRSVVLERLNEGIKMAAQYSELLQGANKQINDSSKLLDQIDYLLKTHANNSPMYYEGKKVTNKEWENDLKNQVKRHSLEKDKNNITEETAIPILDISGELHLDQ